MTDQLDALAAFRECIDYARLAPSGERRKRWEAALVDLRAAVAEARRIAATGDSEGVLDEREIKLHPGQHEFRTVCRLCGEDGMLRVSLITHNERVEITDARLSKEADHAARGEKS